MNSTIITLILLFLILTSGPVVVAIWKWRNTRTL